MLLKYVVYVCIFTIQPFRVVSSRQGVLMFLRGGWGMLWTLETGHISRKVQVQNMFSDLIHKFVAAAQPEQKPKQTSKEVFRTAYINIT